MIKEAITQLVQNKSLSFKETKDVFEEIFSQKATASQIASFLTALKIKGECESEIQAAATIVREKATKVNVRNTFLGIKSKDDPIMDTCGTGGSGLNKFNISTATAFVVSAAGIKVAKHGNKAMSSSCGSADVLEALGVNISVSPKVMEEAIREVGIGFLYAPLYHSALGQVAAIRREIGVRTIFNILGPLCNPALADYQLLGVYDPDLAQLMARVLGKLGTKRAFVVHSKDLGDEISLSGQTKVAFLNGKKVTNLSLTPASFGLKKINPKDLFVKDKQASAKVIYSVLNGNAGAAKDIILANAAACFYILGKVNDLKEGVRMAGELIDTGAVKEKFSKFKDFVEKNA